MRKKRATLKDVAKVAGVSLSSASYAINRTGSLGEDTRQQILKVADELGYRQNFTARATRTGKTGAIGLVVPDMTNPFFPSLAQSVVQRARQGGYSVFVTDTGGDIDQESHVFRQLIERGVDGICWFPVNDANTLESIGAEVPTIVVDRTVPGFECIQADYFEGGRLAAEHLISLGHNKIGIVTGPTDVKSVVDRCDGAATAIRAKAELVFTVENSFSIELSNVVKEAIAERSVTAVFCASDLIAIGVIQFARSQSIRVPDQLAVIGFDDIPWAQYSTPTLSTIEMPVDEMAAEAVDALMRKIEGEPTSTRRVVFGVELISRDSTRANAA